MRLSLQLVACLVVSLGLLVDAAPGWFPTPLLFFGLASGRREEWGEGVNFSFARTAWWSCFTLPVFVMASSTLPVFFGTYTNTSSRGIYAAEFDPGTGRLSEAKLVAEMGSPSFLAVSADRKFLYAVGEQGGGRVESFAIEEGGRKLRALGGGGSGGAAPCDVAVDGRGRTVVVANYTGGSVASFRVGEDGGLGERVTLAQHGHFTNAFQGRQRRPHAHGVRFSPEAGLVLAPDLGGDRVYVYVHDAETSELVLHGSQPWLEMVAGAGPRHGAFSPEGRHFYVINELNNTVSVFAYTAGAEQPFVEVEEVSTLPTGYEGETKTAEVVVSADGRTVYASNRGHDSLAVYARDGESGRLTLRQVVQVGKHPRHFTLSPCGGWLLSAGMESDDVRVYRVEGETGELGVEAVSMMGLARPVCVVFW